MLYPHHHTQEEVAVLDETGGCELMVYNDDVNTFTHVIQTLIRVCWHTPEQAEQCAWLIHWKGKCTVKTGTEEELKPLCDAICEAGIDARLHTWTTPRP